MKKLLLFVLAIVVLTACKSAPKSEDKAAASPAPFKVGNYMFQNCTGLTTPPLMLATSATGGNNCNGMFNGCTALTSLPELHLTNLGNYCFQGAFPGCTSLTSVPEDYLPFTTLTPACYMNMFQNCTGLTNVPNLPATTLQPRCYYHMFEGCTSLTALPSNLLPATDRKSVV